MRDFVELSIIIPVYNCEKYLERCVESVSSQDFENFEVIIVDDGSIDNSLNICKEYARKDSRFKVYSISNHGSAYARNYGLDHANGKYVGFVDSDDYVSNDMYLKLLDCAKQHNADIVSSDMVLIYDDGSETKVTNKFDGGLYKRNDITSLMFPVLLCSKWLTCETPYTMVLKVFRRDFLEENKIRFEDSLLAGQDFVFSTTALYYANTFYYVKDLYCYYYYQNNNSRTHKYLPNAWEIYSKTNDYFKRLTANCKEFNFAEQIKLDRFHGMLMSINYFFKPGNPANNREKISKAISFMNNEINQEVFVLLDFKRMGKKQKIACMLLKHKLYRLFAISLVLYYKL